MRQTPPVELQCFFWKTQAVRNGYFPVYLLGSGVYRVEHLGMQLFISVKRTARSGEYRMVASLLTEQTPRRDDVHPSEGLYWRSGRQVYAVDANALVAYREAAHFTQKAFAAAVGISRGHLSRLENHWIAWVEPLYFDRMAELLAVDRSALFARPDAIPALHAAVQSPEQMMPPLAAALVWLDCAEERLRGLRREANETQQQLAHARTVLLRLGTTTGMEPRFGVGNLLSGLPTPVAKR